jgi:hypothetical protein
MVLNHALNAWDGVKCPAGGGASGNPRLGAAPIAPNPCWQAGRDRAGCLVSHHRRGS